MQRSRAPATTSRRVGLALMRRSIVFRQAMARQAIRTPELAKPRIRHSAERRVLGLQLCAGCVPKYYVSADISKYIVTVNEWPLWVISEQFAMSERCPLYSRKRPFVAASDRYAKGQKR